MVGETIKDLRCEKNYTQKELAEILNITPGCLSKYETGKVQIPLDIILKISEVFDISVDYIIGKNNFSYDYSILNHYYCDKITVIDMLNNAISLSKEKRKILYEVLQSLKCKDDIEKLSQKKNNK